MNDLFDLTGRHALVIGGTGALGGAIAEALIAAGAHTFIAGRNADKGLEAAKLIGAEFIRIDSCDQNSLIAARGQFAAQKTNLSILVNAAGGNSPAATVTKENPIESLSLEAWNENFQLNLVGGVFLPCQVFGPEMIRQKKGSIINIASVSSHIPLSRVVTYSAAKAAVLNLTQFLAREWAPHGVRVNSLTPGFFPAEQNHRLLFHEDGSPTERASQILAHTPMKRFGQPDELGGAAVFLASDKASGFITGTDIRVDGGFLSQTI
ncbi:SDR family oxidoreductase [Oscillatoria laete-virens NRMC-F 0139]|nr:SDR family oxidoreductase [Oscillatoria laete-virens NRMC-F 0139]